MQFLDEAKIFIKSGDGGKGCTSFRREANIPRGGPDGGNGGKGGDIIIKAAKDLNTLIDFRYQQHFKARKGEHGKGSNRDGKSGENLIIEVPVGTQIFSNDHENLIADVTDRDFEKIILKGGSGGFGNAHFKSSTNRAPRRSTEGWNGEEMWVWLKLKLLCDVGLVGMPNAGKSTFLSSTTRAKPKIADYPFTTLKPKLGVCYIDESEFVISDIPGLIEGAHEGHGLGHQFLRHVERSRTILHLIDVNDENFVENYKIIRKELEKYSPALSEKKELIALNKIDLIEGQQLQEKVRKLKQSTNKKIFAVSAVTRQGIQPLLRELNNLIKSENAEESEHTS